MSAIHGACIRIYDGTTLIGGQRNVTINIKSDTVETHSKEDFPWKYYKYSWMEWDCSFDGVFAVDTPANYTEKLIKGQTLSVDITDDSANLASKGTTLYSGTAVVTEFSMEAGQDDIATFSISLQGTGALTSPTYSSSNSGSNSGSGTTG